MNVFGGICSLEIYMYGIYTATKSCKIIYIIEILVFSATFKYFNFTVATVFRCRKSEKHIDQRLVTDKSDHIQLSSTGIPLQGRKTKCLFDRLGDVHYT